MQPGGKCRVSTEAGDFAKHLQKCVLRKVFRLRGIIGHAQTNRINAGLMRMKKSCERLRITFLSALNQVRSQRNRCCNRRIAFHQSLPFRYRFHSRSHAAKCRFHTRKLKDRSADGLSSAACTCVCLLLYQFKIAIRGTAEVLGKSQITT